MLIDYHMHTQPDGDAYRDPVRAEWEAHGGPWSRGWLAVYADAARARAVGEIAITEHIHRFTVARGWLDAPFWAAECTQDIDAYAAGVLAAQADGLPVLLGIEMDWLAGREDDIRAVLAAHPWDVVLGSVHWLDGAPVDDPGDPPIPARHAAEVWHRYLDEWVRAVESGLFDVMAHPDLPKVFGHHAPPEVVDRWDAVIPRVAAAGVAIECSSAGLRKPVGELYPDPSLLARFREAGVPVTLASDAHRPGDVAYGYATAVAALRGAGYTTLTRFRRRLPTQVEFAPWA
ncbi:MAG: PHP domain-containing protein [Thermoleophilia bacterium]